MEGRRLDSEMATMAQENKELKEKLAELKHKFKAKESLIRDGIVKGQLSNLMRSKMVTAVRRRFDRYASLSSPSWCVCSMCGYGMVCMAWCARAGGIGARGRVSTTWRCGGSASRWTWVSSTLRAKEKWSRKLRWVWLVPLPC